MFLLGILLTVGLCSRDGKQVSYACSISRLSPRSTRVIVEGETDHCRSIASNQHILAVERHHAWCFSLGVFVVEHVEGNARADVGRLEGIGSIVDSQQSQTVGLERQLKQGQQGT